MNRRGLFGFFAGAPLGVIAQAKAKTVDNPVQMGQKCECGCPTFGHPIINVVRSQPTGLPHIERSYEVPVASDPTRWVCTWCGKGRPA